MRPLRIPRSPTALLAAGLIALTAAVGVRNALTYPAVSGYDAAEHIDYATRLVEDFELPDTGTFYTPPVFYALAGGAMKAAEALGFDQPEQGAQLLNAAFMVATALLLLVLARALAPGRPVVHLAALAFFVACPLVPRISAMFHPQPLAMLLSTLALVLVVRMIRDGRYRLRDAVLVALTLDLAALVRNVTAATAVAVLLALLGVAIARADIRRRVLTATAVIASLTVLVPAPWYAYLQIRYGSALFGRPGSSVPIQDRWPGAFYVSPALPESVTDPHRPTMPPRFFPTLYVDTWGDYFGAWSWGSTQVELTPSRNDRLTVQSLVGLVPTILAAAGWVALLGTGLRRLRDGGGRLLVGLLPATALAASLAYAVRSPSSDGDTVKAMFLLAAVPCWALGFGVAVDGVLHRWRRAAAPIVLVLLALAVVSLDFGIR